MKLETSEFPKTVYLDRLLAGGACLFAKEAGVHEWLDFLMNGGWIGLHEFGQ